MESKYHKLDKEKILGYLHRFDDKLTSDTVIQLCGSAAILLQGYEFRKTKDIDFTRHLDNISGTILLRLIKENPDISSEVFDTRSPGVVCLLEDYEDRLVEIKDDFKYLRVYVISVVDWIVSKLEAPKFPDLYDYPEFVTEERIEFIENNMDLYCGLVEEKARNSINILKNELKNRKK